MKGIIDTIPLLGVRGDVLIETRDAKTGRLAQRSEGHNLFTNYGLEQFRKMCALAIGGQFGCNVFSREDNIYNDPYNNINSANFGFLKYLILTDNAAALSASNMLIPGTLTGYASRDTYSGSDATRGVINRNESILTSGGFKAVFDFATDRANGTHKSIFWSDFAPASKNLYARLETGIEKKLARNYYQLVEADDGCFYGSVDTMLYKIDPTTLAEIANYTLPAATAGQCIFDVAGGKCYFCTSNSSTTLYVFTISDSTYTTMTLPPVSNTYGGCVVNGYLYYPNNSNMRVYKFNLSDGTSEFKTTSNYANYCIRVGSNLFLYSSGATLYSYNYDTNTMTSAGFNGYTAFRNTYSLADEIWFVYACTSYYDGASSILNYTLKKFNITKTEANMITGKLLDAPITKDNTQTMKVTYTISFS